MLGRTIGLGILSGTVATAYSFYENDFNIDSVGIVRFSRAATTGIHVMYHYKTTLYAPSVSKTSPNYQEIRSKSHSKAAELLLELCRTNKGVYIKIGQHIGALENLFPKEYTDTLKVLHSQAPITPLKEIYKVIKEDLKQDADQLFSEIDPKPLGAASLAQVHKAKLRSTGENVAIKVQHSYVRGDAKIDIAIIETLVNIGSYIFPDFKFQWLVKQTKQNIPKELDFTIEAQNTETLRSMFKHLKWLKVPKIYDEFSSSRVLTLEFFEGGQINDLDYINQNKLNVNEISDKLGSLYSEMIFKNGFVHSDPHPGNLLVNKDKNGRLNLILLDHGLYATLTDSFRRTYAKLWMSILDNNHDRMKKYCTKLGVAEMYGLLVCMVAGRTWDSVQDGIATKKLTDAEKEKFQSGIPLVLTETLYILQTVNPQILLLLKTNDLIRGIDTTLGTLSKLTSLRPMTVSCINTIYDKPLYNSSFWSSLSIHFRKQWSLLKAKLFFFWLSIIDTA
ncbi:putative aarF domain-containing protein kinase 1 [Aphis craccivora]|uniref:Putative aarF domain-containing protein kinase 1 n=1 Tax=Aphis craccivora TaxID=307492 RepID=A0A6G0YAM3_APHCR|nr:putative aarF domain-containing protein kinase 1 [Aphis craccivora]